MASGPGVIELDDFEDGAALDTTNLWVPSGNFARDQQIVLWSQLNPTGDGNTNLSAWQSRSGHAIQIPFPGDSQTLTLTRTFTIGDQGGTLSFTYAAQSENNFDFLTITLDGTTVARVSGTTNPTDFTTSLNSGSHTLAFSLSQDGSVSYGLNALYLDNVKIADPTVNPVSSAPISVTPTYDLSSKSVTLTFHVGTATGTQTQPASLHLLVDTRNVFRPVTLDVSAGPGDYTYVDSGRNSTSEDGYDPGEISSFEYTPYGADGTKLADPVDTDYTIPGLPVIAAVTPPNGGHATVGAGYGFNLFADGIEPLSWSVTGDEPPGMSFTGSTGKTNGYGGTPTAAGTYTFTVHVTNAYGEDHRDFTIVVDPASATDPTIAVPSTFSATLDSDAWSVTLAVEYDTPADASTTLPDAFHVTEVFADGSLADTPVLEVSAPSAATLYAVVIDAGDAGTRTFRLFSSASAADPTDATQDVAVTMPAAPLAPQIDLNVQPGSGKVGTAFSFTPALVQGDAPLHWSCDAAPFGLVFDTGTGRLSGTPASSGTAYVQLTVANATDSDTQVFTISISPADVVVPPSVTSGQPGSGEVNRALSFQYTASDSQPVSGNRWAATGTLPPGLSVDPVSGLLSGTPTQAGSYAWTIVYTNAASGGTASQSQSMTVVAAGTAVQLLTTTLPACQVSVAYRAALNSNLPLSAVSWTLASGTLPPGLALGDDGTTEYLAGTPTQAGQYTFTIRVASKSNGSFDTRTFVLNVTAAPVPLALTNGQPTDGQVGVAYRFAFTVTEPHSGNVWTISAGYLPPGLSVDSASGLLSGTPIAPGDYAFTQHYFNPLTGATTEQPLTLHIAPAAPAVPGKPVFASAAPPDAVMGQPYDYTQRVTGQAPIDVALLAGALPNGIVFDVSFDGTDTLIHYHGTPLPQN